MTAEELRRANAGLDSAGNLLPGFKAVGIRSDGSYVDPKMYQDEFTAGYSNTRGPFTGVTGAKEWAASGKGWSETLGVIEPPAAIAPPSGATIPGASTPQSRAIAVALEDPPSFYGPGPSNALSTIGAIPPMMLWVIVGVAAMVLLK